MPDIIRPFQRVVTAINPHQANRRFLIPKRGKPGAADGPSQTYIMEARGTTNRGFIRGLQGSLSPDIPFNDNIINRVSTQQNGQLFIRLDGQSIPDADTEWNTVTIDGVFDSGALVLTLNRSDRDGYNPNQSGDTQWSFNGQPVMTSGNFYDLTFTWVES